MTSYNRNIRSCRVVHDFSDVLEIVEQFAFRKYFCSWAIVVRSKIRNKQQ